MESASDKRILLVEDDPSDARLIQRAFDKAGIGSFISRLSNGDDAVAYLRGDVPYSNRVLHPIPDLVLLDIKLPRRSGFEVLHWIRAQKSGLGRTPVIMLTSSQHSIDVNRAYDLGVNSYLVKPDNSRELQSLAEEFRQYWMDMNQFPNFLV